VLEAGGKKDGPYKNGSGLGLKKQEVCQNGGRWEEKKERTVHQEKCGTPPPWEKGPGPVEREQSKIKRVAIRQGNWKVAKKGIGALKRNTKKKKK